MRAYLDTVGERLAIDCSLPWVAELIAEGSGGALERSESPYSSIRVHVESGGQEFETRGWRLLTRGAWTRSGEIVIENACTSGFDLHVGCGADAAEFTYRWRPPVRDRAAARVLRSRFHLLVRAVLMQYPALWWAGTRGRAPLHSSACVAGEATPLLTAAGGVGRSTLVLEELRCGGRATGDNLSVGDGVTVWGLVEPLRVDGGAGRRMPHGRHEAVLPGRVEALTPDSVVVLERGASDHASLVACSAEAAAHSIVTNTYMAGELRRYWAFAATLYAATGFGPAHPPIPEVASEFARRLPCVSLALGTKRRDRLSDLLSSVEVAA